MTERLLTDDLAARLAQLTPERRALVERALRQAAASAASEPTAPSVATTIPRRPEGAPVPLTSGQEVLWTLQRAMPSLSAYNVPRVLAVRGALDVDALRAALGAIVARHETLRTRYPEVDGAPRQVIEPAGDLVFDVLDLRERMAGASVEAREAEASRLVAERIRAPFDLATDTPMRVLVVRVGDEAWRVLILTHHIASDEGSRDVLYRELAPLYAGARSGNLEGAVAALPALPVQYGDFAAWQHRELAGGALHEQLAYWRERLAGLPVLDLPTDRRAGTTPAFAGARLRVTFGPEVRDGVRRLAGASGASPYMVALAAVKALLHRYTSQSDVAVGAPVAGRRMPVLEGVIGYFPSQIVLRTQVDADAPFAALVQRVRETCLGAFDHQDVPIERLMEVVTGRDDPHAPLFRVSVQMAGGGESVPALDDVQVAPVATDVGNSKFDLLFGFEDAADGLRVLIEYRTELYDASTIERMAGHLEELLRSAVSDASTPVGALSLLRDAERVQLLESFAGDVVTYEGGDTLVERLNAQVARTPEAVAVVDTHETVSYAELDARATALAWRLRELGVGAGVLVGVCAERSVELVVALVAVVKAGGAYVPIDPEYPGERVAYMLRDSGVDVVLTQGRVAAAVPALGASGAALVALDVAPDEVQVPRLAALARDDTGVAALARDDNDVIPSGARSAESRDLHSAALPLPGADDPAYMIYTSGSTGQPKGALNAHRGIVNRLAWMQAEYQLTPADVVLQKTPFSFDVSVWEFFWPLMTGARLVMAKPGGHRDTSYLAQAMQQHGVTVCHFVPSMLRAFLSDDAARQATTLRAVMASGEALAPDLVAQFYSVLPDARLHNLYGPTECAVDVSAWACPPSPVAPSVVPIGRAVANTRLYVLDARQQPVPLGVPGELYLAGVQVGLGYHHRPELTAERFVPDPYAPSTERPTDGASRTARMYKTGDRARWRPDGTVEYLGRLDFQVKLRGFRIELGEIESALLAHERVRDCVVVARAGDGGEQRLVAYLVCDGEAPSVSTLRGFLLSTLPDYMVPSAFVVLDALPLSSNGKVDRRALPDPRLESAMRERAYEAPRTPVEQVIAGIWAKVLRVERVGVTDDFYELGGDSLLSIQIVSQAARAGLRISLTQVLRNPTVAAQALVAETIETVRADSDLASAQGDVPLTPVQRWFAELETPDAQHWNQAFLFTVPATLDHARLAEALRAVVAHHDALRLRFRRDSDGWRQWYAESAAEESVALARVDLRATTDDDLAAAIAATCELAQASLDLENGPIGRAAHFELGPSRDGRLLLALHHLVVDGVSWRLLREDLESAYEQLERGATIALPSRTSSFAAWSAQLSTLAGSPALHGETAYWVSGTAAGTLSLPCDHAKGANVEGEVVVAESWLSAAETRDLLQRVPAAYGTQINDVLVAALGGALASWLGAGSVLIDLEGHGREDVGGGLDVSRTVGWFTSVFPLRLALARGASPRERLIAAKERLRAVPRRGVGYGVLRYLREAPSLLDGAQAEVMFNYLGQFDQVVAGSRLFGFASEPSGAWRSARARRRHKLEIVALVQDGRLVVRFGYARTVHDATTIDRLAESFATALRGCIAHCLAPDAGGYTPSDFPLAACDQARLDRMLGNTRDVQDVYPLTPIQRMFLDAAGGAVDPGLQQYRFDLEGDIDAGALREAWRTVVTRHDVLRTRFVVDASAPLQIVMRRAELPWREEDWRGETDVAGRLDAFLRADRALGMDVSRAPLMRVALLRTGDARWTMVWTQHHLLLDRWSWPIVLREVGACYDAARRGTSAALPPAAPFRDYVAWLAAGSHDEAERYWRAELAGMGEPLRLLGARDGSAGEPGWDESVVALSGEETAALRQVARARGLAINVVLEGAWAIALSHLGGRDDVTFGLAVDGRGADVSRVGEIVGVTINNVPVRSRLDASRPMGDWLADLQRRQAELRAAEHASPESIQRWSGLEWRHRLFESLVVFQDASADRGMEGWLGAGAKVAGAVTPTETAYPITVLVGGDDRLFIRVLGDRRQVPPALGEQLALVMQAAVRGMSSGLDLSVGALREVLPAVRSWAMEAGSSEVSERVAPRTALESVLARMWGDLLGVGDLGVTDNFLARGGHSLLATQIVSRVRETFQVEVPVRALFQGPTVAELAVAVTKLERKPGQVARIAELIQRVDGMSADELRQSAAARDARARQTAMANGN